MEIKPQDYTVKQLLDGYFFSIPRFQRPYSWDRENVEDFWQDTVVSEDQDYFIGSFVLHKEKSDKELLSIVDGQQRLTTITLLLAAIRDVLGEIGQEALAQSVQKLIERSDINGEIRFVVSSQTPYPYLQEQIQTYPEKKQTKAVGHEQLALKVAFEYLREKVRGVISSIEQDTSITASKKSAEKRRKLAYIRDKILDLQMIAVLLGNEDDAYLIFETLNTRGKDLTVSDLVKNLLTRKIKAKNKGLDQAKDAWKSILDRLHGASPPLSPSRFLHHSWLSRRPYTTEKKLFKELKGTIESAKAAENYLSEISSDAELYRHLLDPETAKWNKQESGLRFSVKTLNEFKVVQPVPMMLAIQRQYRDQNLSLKQVKAVFLAMEKFHVQFTAVTSQRTGGGTAFMYSSSARLLSEAKSKPAMDKVLNEFVEKLQERVPSIEEFAASFVEVEFSDENQRQRALVKYLLRRLDEHLRKSAPVDYDKMTIEHIAPQSGGKKVKRYGEIGNLIFVPDSINHKLDSKAFTEKKKIMTGASVPMDDVLREAHVWDDAAIRERSAALAELFHKKLLKF